jgi:glutamate N-acetyltransferase/amino-acid N-acetyltransferase
MLSFILTDANISSKPLQCILETASQESFNCASVDGDTSTNDTVIVLANGASNTAALSGSDLLKFAKVFNELTLELAKAMVKDGEGAGKLAEIEVRNVKTKIQAKLIAQTIATSPLVKTALFGADANWGRIIAAAGRAGIDFNPDKVDISICGIKVFKKGAPVQFDEKAAKKALSKSEIKIVLDLHCGPQTSKYYACDFSFDYVKINASYRS